MGFWGESVGAVGDEVGADDCEGEVDVVEEAIGPASDGVDGGLAIGVELRDGLELDELEAEGFGGELLGAGI